MTRTCESHYFAGMMCLLARDLTAARAHFEKAVETKQARLASHMLAARNCAASPPAPRSRERARMPALAVTAPSRADRIRF